MARVTFRCALVGGLVLLLSTRAVLAASGSLGAESPQQLVELMQAAADRQDLPAVVSLLAPDDRAVMAVMMIVMSSMMVAFGSMGGEMAAAMGEGFSEGMSDDDKAALAAEQEKAQQEVAALESKLQGILEKHGVADALAGDGQMPDLEGEEGRAAARQLLAGADEVALIRELLAMLDGLGGDEAPAMGPDPEDLRLTQLVVEGDRAHAVAGEERVELVKIDGRWFVELPMGSP